MGVLTGIEPVSVFHYFEEICNIPHGSGNTKSLSDYLKSFADERGLMCIQDEAGNIIIVKEASPGYEDEKTVILQGHIDMVAVKKTESSIDMEKEPLRLKRDGNRIYAQDTSLGGDDGIAVAYALAILDSEALKHPRLEVVLTVDEEIGMDGAKVIDLSMLKGRRMINIDQEEEGVFLTSCAGGVRADIRIPLEYGTDFGTAQNVDSASADFADVRNKKKVQIRIKGLKGGHSGGEIIRGGGNANCLTGRVLYQIFQQIPFGIADLKGGLADNAIPKEAQAGIIVTADDAEKVEALVREIEKEIQGELASKDPEFAIELTVGNDDPAKELTGKVLTVESTERVLSCLAALPNGVQAMSADVEGLVETSLNLGIMKMEDGKLLLKYALRSSVESAKKALCRKLQAVAHLAGASFCTQGDYPGWAYRKDSPLREKMVRIYEEMFGKKPQLQAIHAGLECGMFADKLPGLDCVSIGPDMHDIHTADECLDIASTQRTWQFLVAVLEAKRVHA